MKGCEATKALCAPAGSTVPACAPGPLPSAPSTADAEAAVRRMCASHGMDGCASCVGAAGTADCRDPLRSLAAVCASMPGMRDCAGLAAACGSEGAAALFPAACALAGGGGKQARVAGAAAADAAAAAKKRYTLPPMRMWLHADAEDPVLARQWVPTTPPAVAAACVGAIAGAFLAQALRAGRAVLESRWATALKAGRGRGLGGRAGRNAVRGAATFAISLIDLLLMLVAMTFSWPLIASVAGGYGLGALLLGHVGERGAVGGPPCGGGGAVNGNGASNGSFSTGAAFKPEDGGGTGVGAGGCCDMGGTGHGVKPGV
jgi:hypothetical protein